MKKTILFGVLAFFAINAMGIQDAEAQNPVKKQATTKKVTVKSENQEAEKAQVTDIKAEETVKKDCCADKKEVKKDCKQSDCCKAKSGDKNAAKPELKKEERKMEKPLKADKQAKRINKAENTEK